MTHATDAIFPPPAPLRPFKALMAFRRLVQNKEDTSHVFDFLDHTCGASLRPAFHRFMDGPNGALLTRQDPQALLRAFDDRARLRSLPVGTVGRTYADFMDREGLSTNGVTEASQTARSSACASKAAYPDYAAFVGFLNLTHDMFHVLTGYNRDSLGEAALLQYTSRIDGSRGARLLGHMAALQIKREAPGLPVFKVMANGRAMADRSSDLIQADFIGMLDRPLRQVREDLHIVPDPVYASLPQEKLLGLVQPQAG
ncbi:MAG: hypothetical protein AAF788_03960 [Pseudomonadota bacterium]